MMSSLIKVNLRLLKKSGVNLDIHAESISGSKILGNLRGKSGTLLIKSYNVHKSWPHKGQHYHLAYLHKFLDNIL